MVSLITKTTTSRGFGYAVFGEVIDGMDVVDTIGKTRTHASRHVQKMFQLKNISIKNMSVIE